MKHLSMKKWAVEDLPREKWIREGKRALSTAELLAIIIGSGGKSQTAIDIARQILNTYDQDLEIISQLTVQDFEKFQGIGKVKAMHLASVFELAARRKLKTSNKVKITSSRAAFDHLGPLLIGLPHEEFWIIILNRANHVIRKKCISKGGVSGTVVDIKLILKALIEVLASSVILFHNHPSGNLEPSTQDLNITLKIKKAVQQMDIQLLDHLIIGNNAFYSFADEGKL